MISTVVEFPTAFVTGDGAFDRFHAMDDGETVRANVGVVALHFTALEGQCVIRLLTGDAKIHAGCLPFGSVGINPAAATTLVSDEMGELVLQGPP